MTTVEAATAARTTGAVLARLLRVVVDLAMWLAGWVGRHWRYALSAVLVAVVAAKAGATRVEVLAVLAATAPALVAVVWSRCWPVSYERFAAGPHRRWRWRRWVRRQWPGLARDCGLSVQRTRRSWSRLMTVAGSSRSSRSSRLEEPVWVHPRLTDVTTAGNTLTLLIRGRRGQTVDDLEKAAGPLAASGSAVSWRTRPLSPSVIEVTLVMREALAAASVAVEPGGLVDVDAVRMGRRQDGTDWRLQLRGRHTLAVGCSGSGKGSILWGVAAGLAPAVRADLVRLWGLDLKKGVEVGMGQGLFHTTADSAGTALTVLARLIEVLDERGRRMAGVTRLHEPTPGDPLHVLVIDELADLIAYSEPTVRAEANRLLAVILTQGRALGVVVVACVQDPRKDTVTMRGLFTQTIALRLRSADETRMVLGDGMAALAPAHRLSPTAQGSAWVVEDDGTVDRVRADYWPDPLIRHLAASYPAPVVETAAAPREGRGDVDQAAAAWLARKPRTPRAPRPPRLARPSDDQPGGEAA